MNGKTNHEKLKMIIDYIYTHIPNIGKNIHMHCEFIASNTCGRSVFNRFKFINKHQTSGTQKCAYVYLEHRTDNTIKVYRKKAGKNVLTRTKRF